MNSGRGSTPACLVVTPGSPLHGDLPLFGQASLPGDKSISHRALVLASLAQGRSRIENLMEAGVTRVLLASLEALGVQFSLHDKALELQGRGLELEREFLGGETMPVRLDCGNSATTMRLLAGLLSTWGRPALLDGSPGLRARPMNRIVEPLRRMGVSIESSAGCAPLTISPTRRPLRSLHYQLPTASAQVKSCLALAALVADGVTTLIELGPSRDHTERMLLQQGLRLERETIQLGGVPAYAIHIHPASSDSLDPIEMTIPGDFSAAAFLIVAAIITPGSEIRIRGAGVNPTRTGLLDALVKMGAEIQIENQQEIDGEPVGDIISRYSSLRGIEVAGEMVVRMIDEFPAFAIAAACANGVTTVADAGELRHKESDRIRDLVQELTNLGVSIWETADGFQVQGGRAIRGGEVDPHGDHRLAMALALAGLVSQSPVTVQQAQIIDESFPAFALALQSLGGRVILSSADPGERGR